MSYRSIPIFLLSMATAYAPAQSMYPTVSNAEQKVRDDDRVPLLESELAFEREALEKAKKASAAGATDERFAAIHRHEENIRALGREISGLEKHEASEHRSRAIVKAVRVPARFSDSKRTSNFWDPYNRGPDTTDFSTSPRRDSHE